MDDNDKQMTLPGMEDSDELTNPLTSSTKELVNELLQDDAQLTPQRRALCTLLLTCARTIDRLCRKGRDSSRMVTSYNETIDRLQPSETSAKAGDLAQLLKDMAQ